MTMWLCRAGKQGEYETKFIEEKKVYCTWGGLDWDLQQPKTWEAFKAKLSETYPNESASSISNQAGQLWRFAREMKQDDWVITPSKTNPTIHIGIITNEYSFDPSKGEKNQHSLAVKWVKEFPRDIFEQDLLYSFGAYMTFCQISRNDAERRIKEKVNGITQAIPIEETVELIEIDIEESALQEISDKIIRLYQGHDLAKKIIAPILRAKGFTTYVSPEGPDKGVDILASLGPLGFDHPRICVQVKSGSNKVDRPTHDQLMGVMKNHKADYGLFVSWGGFNNHVDRDEASHFFEVRLWRHFDVVQEFLRHYESMPEEVKSAIPLKRIWIVDKSAD